MEKYTAEDISKECGVSGGAIIAFLKYRIEYGLEVPSPIPYEKSKYTFTKEDAQTIATLFKTRKKGEMSEYNYRHNYGKSFREKYKNPNRHAQKQIKNAE